MTTIITAAYVATVLALLAYIARLRATVQRLRAEQSDARRQADREARQAAAAAADLDRLQRNYAILLWLRDEEIASVAGAGWRAGLGKRN